MSVYPNFHFFLSPPYSPQLWSDLFAQMRLNPHSFSELCLHSGFAIGMVCHSNTLEQGFIPGVLHHPSVTFYVNRPVSLNKLVISNVKLLKLLWIMIQFLCPRMFNTRSIWLLDTSYPHTFVSSPSFRCMEMCFFTNSTNTIFALCQVFLLSG